LSRSPVAGHGDVGAPVSRPRTVGTMSRSATTVDALTATGRRAV